MANRPSHALLPLTDLMFELEETTIRQTQAALDKGEISCKELLASYLTRIKQFDEGLKSVIAVNPNAQGLVNGPLRGVPVLVKDNLETADMPTTAGSASLRGFCSGRDAAVVTRLRNAGAIVFGKLNLHEFAIWGETVSSILGQTVNPYDHSRTPGGSSGGTGVAVSANFSLVGIGTDTVNSVRSPASACCLCGIRPTIGLVDGDGIVPYSLTQDTAGPLARTVEDAVRVLEVIAGREYLQYLKKDGLAEKRLGILGSFFGKGKDCRPVNTVMGSALSAMEAAEAKLLVLPDLIDSTWLASEVSVHLHELKAHLGEYLKSVSAPVQSIDDILASGKYSPSIEANLISANKLSIKSPEYHQRMQLRKELQATVIGMFERERLDAMIFPQQQQLVCKIGESQKMRNGALGAITGFPSIVVPTGFSPPTDKAPLGVPVGLEILGKPRDEGRLIEIAYAFEQATMVRRAPF